MLIHLPYLYFQFVRLDSWILTLAVRPRVHEHHLELHQKTVVAHLNQFNYHQSELLFLGPHYASEVIISFITP